MSDLTEVITQWILNKFWDMNRHSGNGKNESLRNGLIVFGLLVVAGFFLLTEHWVHFLGYIPYILLLLCPLMHLFMHKGHGSHDHAGNRTYEHKK